MVMGPWWLWFLFMFVFLVPPMGYGWGYRGWGPPWPRYVQQRRAERAAVGGGGGPAFDHRSWGLAGDFFWLVLFGGMAWALAGLWWR